MLAAYLGLFSTAEFESSRSPIVLTLRHSQSLRLSTSGGCVFWAGYGEWSPFCCRDSFRFSILFFTFLGAIMMDKYDRSLGVPHRLSSLSPLRPESFFRCSGGCHSLRWSSRQQGVVTTARTAGIFAIPKAVVSTKISA